VLFGRTVRGAGPSDHVLPPRVGLVELPHYESLRRVRAVARAGAATAAAMWRGLDRVDRVWVLGPNPFGIVLIVLALVRRKQVALGVRQDTVAYFRARLPSRRWTPALVLVRAMDAAYRLLARRLPTVVVGSELARTYRRGFATTIALVRAVDVATAPPDRDWSGTVELLAVGRIDPEKNPLALVEALARLERERPGRYTLRCIGRGPLEHAVRARARALGIADRVELAGYVPFGPALLDAYRRAHVLVQASLTEGVPQVVVEALACGTPVVATDVGGVRAALDGGRAGLLVPAGDVGALVDAVRSLTDDAALRARVVARGLELARETTLEVEAGRVGAFLAARD
jgi:glycosyltransferase involved in cell wall biosynthesis